MKRPDWNEEELAQWEWAAARLLRGLGLCPFRKGDRALCLLLALAAAHPEQLAEGLEALYAETAQRKGVAADSVERVARRSLYRLWKQGDRRLLRSWFARLKGGPCPGNAAFLTILARKVREGQVWL